MSEGDAVDRMLERMAREEQDDIDRQAGQRILDIMADASKRREQGEDPLFETLRQAHQAKASEATDQQ